MGKTYSEIDEGLRAFVERQHVFFVATAPSSVDGHVNCSPKGLDTLRIVGVDGDVPRLHGQRRGDDRARPGERADRGHVLRVGRGSARWVSS